MTSSTEHYVFLIGAPRSGTNMLRDVLSSVPNIATWPCDEINYIWRHGNVRFPSDEFLPDMATEQVGLYIRNQFDKLARRTGAKLLLEKTCANSLRVPFLDAVAPDARYIFLVRDGVDVVGSARLRWTARLDFPYLVRKLRYVPPSDFPYYSTRYLYNLIWKVMSDENRLASWGPVTNSMKEWHGRYTLLQVCALQWQACVNAADEALKAIGDDRVFRVSYESFVQNPAEEIQALRRFLDFGDHASHFDAAVRCVSPASIGRGRSQLSESEIASIVPLIRHTLTHHGYKA